MAFRIVVRAASLMICLITWGETLVSEPIISIPKILIIGFPKIPGFQGPEYRGRPVITFRPLTARRTPRIRGFASEGTGTILWQIAFRYLCTLYLPKSVTLGRGNPIDWVTRAANESRPRILIVIAAVL